MVDFEVGNLCWMWRKMIKKNFNMYATVEEPSYFEESWRIVDKDWIDLNLEGVEMGLQSQ